MPVPIVLVRNPTETLRVVPPAMPAAGFFGTAPTTYLRVPNAEPGEATVVTVGTAIGDEIGDTATGDAVVSAAGADPLGTNTTGGPTFWMLYSAVSARTSIPSWAFFFA